MGKIRTYVGTDGKLHFVNSGGADSVLPFSSSYSAFLFYSDTTNIGKVLLNYNTEYLEFIAGTSYSFKVKEDFDATFYMFIRTTYTESTYGWAFGWKIRKNNSDTSAALYIRASAADFKEINVSFKKNDILELYAYENVYYPASGSTSSTTKVTKSVSRPGDRKGTLVAAILK